MNSKMQRWTSILMVFILVTAFIQLPHLTTYAASPKLSTFTAQQISKAIVLKLECSNTLVNNVQKPLDSSSVQVTPIVRSNTTFVPLRFMSENFGAAVNWDQKSQTATVTLGAKTIKATLGQKSVKINNKSQSIATSTFQISGRVFIPLRIISEAFGKNVYYNNGIIILSNTKPAFDSSKEQQLLSELITWFSYSDTPELTVRQIVQKYDDSVATILVNDYYGQTIGQGSGFYIGNGLFITNNHVLAEGYSYDLLLNNGQVIEAAGVVKYDMMKDLAIIKTKQLPNLVPVKIGSKTLVQKGDRIVTIGSPMGLTNTVSDGLVSAIRALEGGIDMIQISAPITSGSSGSPLFNMYGFVIGVNTLGYEGTGNLNFAVAIDAAAAWIKELAAKDFKTLPVISQSIYLSQGGSTPKPSEMPQAPIDFDIELDFEITDAVKHPDKPIIYISDKLSSKLYSINYETKEQKSISFNYTPESIDFYDGEIYVAIPKSGHQYYTTAPLQGAIAVVDAESFTLKQQFDINMDPFDIVAGRDGHVYVISGSNQWTDIASYSLATKQQVSKSHIRHQSFAVVNPIYNNIYTIDTDSSPRDVSAYSYSNGIISSYSGSPYHGEYSMGTRIKVTPDGRYLFNNAGTVFSVGSTKDIIYKGKLDNSYSDVAFDLTNGEIFTGRDAGIIDIYDYKTFKLKNTMKTKGNVKYLFYDSNKLIAITRDDNKTLNKITNGIMITNVR